MITEDKKNKFISTALINKRCITTVRALTKVRISICIEGSILYRVLSLPIGILVIMTMMKTMIMVMMDMSIMSLSCPDIHVFLKKKFFFFHHSGCVFYQTFLFYLSFQILVYLHHDASCPDIHVFSKKKFFFFHHSGCVFYQTFLFLSFLSNSGSSSSLRISNSSSS